MHPSEEFLKLMTAECEPQEQPDHVLDHVGQDAVT
jgi:hypothetical protein